MSPRRLVVEADGGSRGNPGVAGYGALVRDETGRAVRELAAPLGKASNNVAEYTGLIVGLEAARDLAEGQAAEVDVRLDSKLVVEQMSGRWKIKHADMARLAQQAREVVAEITQAGGSVSFTWIPRAQNKDADALSNEGMDGHHVDHRPGESQPLDAEDETEVLAELVPAPQPLPRAKRSPDLGEATRIVLVRHGVTDFTTSGRLDGRWGHNPELSAEGLRQARAVGAGLQAFLGDTASDARVVTSELARAAQTGAAIGAVLGLRPSVDRDWDEIDFGDWDGKLVSELMNSHGDDFARLRAEAQFRAPGGESHADLSARVHAAFDRLLHEPSQGTGTIIVVTHRSPIGAVLAQVLGMPPVMTWRLGISPASITSIRAWSDGEMLVEFVNDTAHLR